MGKKGDKKTGGRKQFIEKVVCNVCNQWENIPVEYTTKQRKAVLHIWKKHMYRHISTDAVYVILQLDSHLKKNRF